jgi:hypothetical protein
MTTRTSAVLLCASLGLVVGCANQPAAPSAPESTGPVGSPSAAPPTAAAQSSPASPSRFGPRAPGVVYVTSQGLYYDTFATADPLPMEGRFQLLAGDQTEFGPGQPGYLGGRWWVDVNANGIQDAGDHFFLCPLLPPGRETP